MGFKMAEPKSAVIDTFFRNHTFVVPEFQRYYDWQVKDRGQVERLWADLNEYVLTINNNPARQQQHFFGASILYTSKEDPSARQWLIDGQQRTVTLACLFAAIRDLARVYDSTDRLKTDAGDLIWNNRKKEPKITSRVDEKDNKALMQVSDPETYWKTGTHDPPSGKGNTNRIVRSYVYFLGAFEKLLDSEKIPQGDYEVRLNILATWFEQIKDTTYLHYVETDSLDQAYIMFDSQNSTGMGLDPSDILKVRLMEIARHLGDAPYAAFLALWKTTTVRCLT